MQLGFAVPGLAHPLAAPDEWVRPLDGQAALHWVALNVADGPGSCPDAHCVEAAGRLSNAGVPILGVLDLRRGTRAFGDLIPQARRYLDWYRLDGFLLDHCPTERAGLSDVRRMVTTLRALAESPHIVLGHGIHPYPGYVETADQLVTFCGPWSAYRWSQVAQWTADYPAHRFCHLVHSLPRGHLDEALRIARWQGAGTISFTDRTVRRGGASPWEAMPGYWDEIVSRIGTGVSE
jgi:hypothetical protein